MAKNIENHIGVPRSLTGHAETTGHVHGAVRIGFINSVINIQIARWTSGFLYGSHERHARWKMMLGILAKNSSGGKK